MKIGQPNESLEVWDAGTYPAQVVKVEDDESKYPGNEGKPRLKWTFRVSHPETGETSDIWHWTNATLSTHKMATFRPIVRVLLPDLDLDDKQLQITTERDFLGKRCRVILGIDEERGRNRIEKVLPVEARSRQPQPDREPVAAGRRDEPVPTVAQRRAAAATEPTLDEAPPF